MRREDNVVKLGVKIGFGLALHGLCIGFGLGLLFCGDKLFFSL